MTFMICIFHSLYSSKENYDDHFWRLGGKKGVTLVDDTKALDLYLFKGAWSVSRFNLERRLHSTKVLGDFFRLSLLRFLKFSVKKLEFLKHFSSSISSTLRGSGDIDFISKFLTLTV